MSNTIIKINNQTLARCSLLINAPMFVATSLGEPTLSSLHEIE